MPLYELQCESCARTFEVMTSFADLEERSVCPDCGAHARRLFGSVQLAGKRTSVAPGNFVRPHGPVAGRGGGSSS